MRFVVQILAVLIAAQIALAAPSSQKEKATSLSDSIRAGLQTGVPRDYDDDTRWEVAADSRKLIVDHLPESGDVLLSLIEAREDQIERFAVNAFVDNWDKMSNEQVARCLKASLIPSFQRRPKYPRGVGAMIGMGYQFRHGWGSRPASDKLKFVTSTTHFLDDKQYGDSFRYPYASCGCRTGWIQTKNLSLGVHTMWLTVEYTAGEGAQQVTGTMCSDMLTFEMLPENTPDDLIAPDDPQIDQQVRRALRIAETEEYLHPQPAFLTGDFQELPDPWRPQITWKENDGTANGLHVPVMELNESLPVDLCFAVTLRVEASGEEYEGDPLVVIKGTKQMRNYFAPRDTTDFCKGRAGFVPVRIILKPSQANALTDPKVTRYFPGEIVSEVVSARIGPQKDQSKPEK